MEWATKFLLLCMLIAIVRTNSLQTRIEQSLVNPSVQSDLEEIKAWQAITKNLLEKIIANQDNMNLQLHGDCVKAVKLAPHCYKLLHWADVYLKNFFYAGGRTFYITDNTMTYSAATSWCTAKYMKMPMLKDLALIQRVAKAIDGLRRPTYSSWLAASDTTSTPGKYFWIDKTRVQVTLWNEDYPKAFGRGYQTCVTLPFNQTGLGDLYCSSSAYTLCEVPTEYQACV